MAERDYFQAATGQFTRPGTSYGLSRANTDPSKFSPQPDELHGFDLDTLSGYSWIPAATGRSSGSTPGSINYPTQQTYKPVSNLETPDEILWDCRFSPVTGDPYISLPHSVSEPRLRQFTHERTHSLPFSPIKLKPAPLKTNLKRPLSPTKTLQDVTEEEADEMLVGLPQKRPRSPMKRMFGENGWLGRSTSFKEEPNELYKKKKVLHWKGKLAQKSDDVSRLRISNPFNATHTSAPVETESKVTISLDPVAQSKLYSEVELMIIVSANSFIMQQHREGYLSLDSIKKITAEWKSKGRPQVVEFMFDQATQRDLVALNAKTFRFATDKGSNAVANTAMLLTWRVLAKEMSVRTLCAPDPAVRKHLHDVGKLLEFLEAPMVTLLAFNAVKERALQVMREETRKREEAKQMQLGREQIFMAPPRSSSLAPLQNFQGDFYSFGSEI